MEIQDNVFIGHGVMTINDLHPPSFKKTGSKKSWSRTLIKKGAKFFCSSRKGAELIKYASNAFLATKITFINEIANLCETAGISVEDISVGMGSDARIGSRFLRAGPVSYTHLTLPTNREV